MNCVHCGEQMNEGASVCKACRRRQISFFDQYGFTIFCYSFIGIAVVGFVVYTIWNSVSKNADINSIVACEHANGNPFVSKQAVKSEIKAQAFGRAWKDGVAAVRIMHGCDTTVD